MLITVKNSDQQEAIGLAEKFEKLGFELYATPGCASVLNRHMIATNVVRKMDGDHPNLMDLIESGKLDYSFQPPRRAGFPRAIRCRCAGKRSSFRSPA